VRRAPAPEAIVAAVHLQTQLCDTSEGQQPAGVRQQHCVSSLRRRQAQAAHRGAASTAQSPAGTGKRRAVCCIIQQGHDVLLQDLFWQVEERQAPAGGAALHAAGEQIARGATAAAKQGPELTHAAHLMMSRMGCTHCQDVRVLRAPHAGRARREMSDQAIR
jgi:hypothetical protein